MHNAKTCQLRQKRTCCMSSSILSTKNSSECQTIITNIRHPCVAEMMISIVILGNTVPFKAQAHWWNEMKNLRHAYEFARANMLRKWQKLCLCRRTCVCMHTVRFGVCDFTDHWYEVPCKEQVDVRWLGIFSAIVSQKTCSKRSQKLEKYECWTNERLDGSPEEHFSDRHSTWTNVPERSVW